MHLCSTTWSLLLWGMKALQAKGKPRHCIGEQRVSCSANRDGYRSASCPGKRYPAVPCTCQGEEVGCCCCSLLCSLCKEFNCRNTSWISNNSLYSPSGSQDNKHDFLIHWALPAFIFAIFLTFFFFFLIFPRRKNTFWEQWWRPASLFMTLWISVWVIGSESCSANYTRLMNCVITAAALHINWMHINDSSYSNLNDVWRSDVAHCTLIIFVSNFGSPA